MHAKNTSPLPTEVTEAIKEVTVTRVELAIQLLLFLTLLIVGARNLWLADWFRAFEVFGVFCMMLLPKIFSKKLVYKYPIEIETVIVMFIFAAMFLGEIQGFYEKFVWWDTLLHTLYGFIGGIFAFLLVYTLTHLKPKVYRSPPSFTAFFSFIFTMAFAALWELLEFSFDQLFEFEQAMQAGGLEDTMIDILVAFVGGSCVAIIGYVYIKFVQREG